MRTLPIRRTIHPQIRVLDVAQGLVEYVASDESLDSYHEIIRAKGWKFDRFGKNAPFVDSHQYDSIEHLVGKVVDFKVDGDKLVETAQWAIDVPSNTLAARGFAMTAAGYLKAVSVGFDPEITLTPYDARDQKTKPMWDEQMEELDLDVSNPPRAIYVQQQQLELSSCIIGANMNALARSYKAGILNDQDLEMLSHLQSQRVTARPTDSPGDVERARRRARFEFAMRLSTLINRL